MRTIPKAYQELAAEIGQLLQNKPKKGYMESLITDGQVEALDNLELANTALRLGEKSRAHLYLQEALDNPQKQQALTYVEELETHLQQLLEKSAALEDLDNKVSTEKSADSRLGLVIFIVCAAAFATALVFIL